MLTEKTNPDATTPTGMCGSSTVCEACPSHFLCWLKAKEEQEIIRNRKDNPTVGDGAGFENR